MPFQLIVTRGPNLGQTFDLRSGQYLLIGRGDDCDFQILDAAISRHHCRVLVEQGRVKIEDLNSTWGTVLNGQKIDVRPLQLNDSVTLGDSELRLQVSPNAATLEHPASQVPETQRSTQRKRPRRKKNRKPNNFGSQSPKSDPPSRRRSVEPDSRLPRTPKRRARYRENRSSRRSTHERSQLRWNGRAFATIGAISAGLVLIGVVVWTFVRNPQPDEDPRTVADASQTAKTNRTNGSSNAPKAPPLNQNSAKPKRPPRQHSQPVAKSVPPRKTNAPKIVKGPTKRPPLKKATAKSQPPKLKPKPGPKVEVKPLDLAELTKSAAPALVRVEISEPQGLESGTGFVIDSNGLIATSYHLIQKAKVASVVFADGQKFPVLGARFANSMQDLVFLKIDPGDRKLKPLRPTPYGNAMNIPVASFALGSENGIRAQAGKIVSLPKVKDLNAKGVPFSRGTWVQTSIPLSPLGRGGPILDKLGELVGINIVPFPDDSQTALACSHLGIQHGLLHLSPEVVSLDKLRQDKRLAEFGLDVYLMTEDAQVAVPETIKRKVRELARNGSKPLTFYAKNSGPRFSDQSNKWRRGLYESYQTNGTHDPAWDAYAEKLLLPNTLTPAETKTVIDGIFSSKCNDPAILMACASLMRPSVRTLNTAKRAARLLEASAYPPRSRYPLWQLYVGIARKHAGSADLVSQALSKSDDDFLKALCRSGLSEYERRMLFDDFDVFFPDALLKLRREGPVQALSETEMDPWLRDMVLGTYHFDLGWEARGLGWAQEVPKPRWEIFQTHLKKARLHFLKAWQRHSDSPEAAMKLVAVSKSIPGIAGENGRFWFEQAISAQFDYQPAYREFVYAIEPRWGGSQQLLLEFGQECLSTRRFDTIVPSQYHRVIVAIARDPNVPPRSLILGPDIIEAYRLMTDGYQEVKSDIYTTAYLDTQMMCALANGNEEAKVEARKRLKDLGDRLDHKAIQAFGLTYASIINRLNR